MSLWDEKVKPVVHAALMLFIRHEGEYEFSDGT